MMDPNGAAGVLRSYLESPALVRLIGAHNALGARMAERAGFDGVWSSGLELSTSYGVPDASLVTMSEHLSTLQAMTYCDSLPIVADCDTGYGDACNVAYMVRKFEAAGVAGVAIEDKCFPKRNSFLDVPQDLATVDEFAAKIESAREARRHDDFVIVARTEALIVGQGPDEALKRAHAYADAGADAILFHSKERSIEKLAEVLTRWQERLPVVLVPTTYPQVDASELERLGAKIVIYANHGLRASLRAMERTYKEILRSGSTRSVEPLIWPLSTVFDLQHAGHPQRPGHELNGTHGHGANGHGANGHGANGHGANGPGANGPGANGHGANGVHVDGAHLNGGATDGSPKNMSSNEHGAREVADGNGGPHTIAASEVADLLLAQGLDQFVGVPDSTCGKLYLELENREAVDYLPAVSEEAAIGVATGGYLTGRSPALLMQNSGLGTVITALASLVIPYDIPLMMVVGWRGTQGDDTPEHKVMGRITPGLLDLLEIPFEVLDPGRAPEQIASLVETARRRKGPAALVVQVGVVQ